MLLIRVIRAADPCLLNMKSWSSLLRTRKVGEQLNIQWFPGHMAKAEREMRERLDLVDIIFEMLDARAVRASQNPLLEQVGKHKPRLILLNKMDLAEAHVTRAWLNYFKTQGRDVLPIDAKSGKGMNQLGDLSRKAVEHTSKGTKLDMLRARRPLRAMVVGIPNVGKSSLINRLARKKVANVGDRPGVTRALSWIKTRQGFDLLDSPGVLWPKFEDRETALKLAAIGSIADERFDALEVATYLLSWFIHYHPQALEARYGAWVTTWLEGLKARKSGETLLIDRAAYEEGEKATDPSMVQGYKQLVSPLEASAFFEHMRRVRGLLDRDIDHAALLFIREVQLGRLGPISLDRP